MEPEKPTESKPTVSEPTVSEPTGSEPPPAVSPKPDSADSSARAKPKPNLQVAIIGCNGTGKTTRAKARTIAAVRAGWWAWVHDPNDDFAGLGPVYPDGPAFMRVAAQGPIHPIARFRGRPADLIRINEDTGQPMPGGIASFAAYGARPTFLVFDESSIIGDHLGTERQILQIILRRRHLGLGLIFVVQYVGACHKTITRMATEIDLFRTVDRDDLRTLRRRGVGERYTSVLPHLDDYQFVTCTPGR